MNRSISPVGLIAAAMIVFAITAAPATAQGPNCVPSMNVEAIIDDSSSMLDTDPERLRVRAMDLFVHMPGPTSQGGTEDKTLGVVEFSGEVRPLFGPGPIGPNADAIAATLESEVIGDGTTGTSTGTDYNDAFNGAASHNPNATSRIFLTDGGHLDPNGAAYMDTHRGGPPTFVLGFGSAISQADSDRLARIAAETGGQYFPATDNTTLQSNMGKIIALLNCLPPPRTKVFDFGPSETKKARVPIAGGVDSLRLTLSWLNDQDRFDLGKLVIKRNGKTVAGTGRRFNASRRLDVEEEQGETFIAAEIGNVRRGKLSFPIDGEDAFVGGPVTLQTSPVGPD